MADTFRALCSELLRGLDENRHPEVRYPGHLRQIMASARAALADEPAVPEGREPAAVITEPSDEEGPSIEDVEELCEEHCFNVIGYESIERLQGLINEAIARWGNLKASLTSSPPADGEVAELVAWLRANSSGIYRPAARAAELLQQQVLVPVSVSERLPGPEDCDAEGRCWWWDGEWGLIEQRFTDYIVTHWLPAHALPLPEVNND